MITDYIINFRLCNNISSTAEVIWHQLNSKYVHKWRKGMDLEGSGNEISKGTVPTFTSMD
jgi:hypothetical protein